MFSLASTQLSARANVAVSTSFQAKKSQSATTSSSRTSLVVEANKKTAKKTSVVMLESIEHVGEAGEMVSVSAGFFRNFLEPQGKAQKATQQLIQEFKNKQAEELAAVEAEQAAAQAIATALSTIGKFVVKKTVGEDDKIFGSVTAKDCADSIEKQTGKALDTKGFDIPDISTIGVYEVSVKLHPKVTGSFKVDVQKE
jgi:large subunit ribosomal protein L9|tara:strand:+ start:5413 stop:6006 length:594 start_codon:yes stop_codon:yes gene_type:complete|mmetsp:Transcript_8753/g.25494  ORF Transcript_8753/g.25494 Transcript_8753/m.25494 type:complete len:198 (+) Transcript_8753:1438-2031(+)